MNVLAIDLGTSATKAIIWNTDDGVIASAAARIETTHPQQGWDEQNASRWITAVDELMRELTDGDLTALDAITLSGQRETFVCLDESGQPLRPAILWSDGRGASPAARFAWLSEHEPEAVQRTRWLAAPKDVVVQSLTGRLVTDHTLVARTDVDAALLPVAVAPRVIVGDCHGVPVIGGAGDRACEAFAVGAAADKPMVSWGTTANVSLPA